MASTYVTKDGDSVDAIAWRFYGSTTGRVVESVLAANRGLAEYGPTLPAGVRIALPEPSTTTPTIIAGVRLWD